MQAGRDPITRQAAAGLGIGRDGAGGGPVRAGAALQAEGHTAASVTLAQRWSRVVGERPGAGAHDRSQLPGQPREPHPAGARGPQGRRYPTPADRRVPPALEADQGVEPGHRSQGADGAVGGDVVCGGHGVHRIQPGDEGAASGVDGSRRVAPTMEETARILLAAEESDPDFWGVSVGGGRGGRPAGGDVGAAVAGHRLRQRAVSPSSGRSPPGETGCRSGRRRRPGRDGRSPSRRSTLAQLTRHTARVRGADCRLAGRPSGRGRSGGVGVQRGSGQPAGLLSTGDRGGRSRRAGGFGCVKQRAGGPGRDRSSRSASHHDHRDAGGRRRPAYGDGPGRASIGGDHHDGVRQGAAGGGCRGGGNVGADPERQARRAAAAGAVASAAKE